MKWKGKLIDHIFEEIKKDSEWQKTSERILIDPTIGVHLAIFNEPFLALIYKGEKKIESRFSINQVAPFNKVSKGDVIILKSSGGPVTGIFLAGNVNFFSNLTKSKFKEIERLYGKKICAHYDSNFWINRALTKFVTLIEVDKIKALTPFRIEKKDRTAWSILRQSQNNLLL
ncbi:MAG: hypothetical protein JWP81_5213 [Ferruginibacter sp.]|nr:hypothetical protein [Ferruginibacter sp.]